MYLSNNGKLEPRPSASLSCLFAFYLVLAETNDQLIDELAIWLAPNAGSVYPSIVRWGFSPLELSISILQFWDKVTNISWGQQ